MVETSTSELESGRHRRLIVAALLRASLTTAVLVAVYYVLPMNEELHLSAVIRLIVGLVVFAVVVTWEVRSILRSKYPGVQAVQALAVAAPLFLLVFASTYFLMSGGGSANFSQSMTRTDALYFTVTTFATVGYGDIVATSQPARVIVTVQMILDLLILGLGLRALLGAVKMGRERKAGTDTGPTSG
ncbi:MAG TPA: potassium channel family protein [Jiangellaceae bacterium]|jgi:voltage-gated potassium channel|nr:potassium channel family protein [Jiangellaceae bacterium]